MTNKEKIHVSKLIKEIVENNWSIEFNQDEITVTRLNPAGFKEFEHYHAYYTFDNLNTILAGLLNIVDRSENKWYNIL